MALLSRRKACLAAICACWARTAYASERFRRWEAIERAARTQTVYFNAWAGDPAVNSYIGWVGREVRHRYGLTLVHVKLSDTAVAVNRILAEHAAGRESGGSVDLIWINGESFASLLEHRLLFGPWTDELPHAQLLEASNPSVNVDFTLPTRGLEMAWGSARLTLFYDARAVPEPPPRDPDTLLQWIGANPGRFTYPQPPEFLGTSFLKQLLLLQVSDRDCLQHPVGADFDSVTRSLWAWLARARPHLWRAGRVYPPSGPEQQRLLGDGELDWAMSFNPAEANRAIRAGDLPATVRATSFRGGILINSHYLAIPRNARAKEAAMVVANFLLSPEAQARKADEAIWGDPTVLAMDALTPAERRRFAELKTGPAISRIDAPLLTEPHPSWTTALAHTWTRHFGSQ